MPVRQCGKCACFDQILDSVVSNTTFAVTPPSIMRNTFGLLLLLGAGLAFFSSRSGPAACQACNPAVLIPNLSSMLFPVKIDLPYPPPPPPEQWRPLNAQQRLSDTRSRLLPQLDEELVRHGAKLGDSAFIRIFKESKELELWLKPSAPGKWTQFRTYPIAAFSGKLGPKLMEGDGQAPEGFYSVGSQSLNPASSFHLSFNIGYPNAYDRFHERTGSFIMVHGSDVSVGCFAMTNPVIEEIYLIVEAALAKGQSEVPVHIFPFRMTDERLARAKGEAAEPFWQQLRTGYSHFEKTRTPPAVTIQDGEYRLSGE